MANRKMPHKKRKPDLIDSVVLDRSSFIQMTEDFRAILEKHTKKEYIMWVHVDEYEGIFESAEDVVDTLDSKTWISRKSLSISYYVKEKDGRYNWDKGLDLYLSDARVLGYGMRIEFGKIIEDVERLAIMQDVNGFIYKYRRSYYLKGGTVNTIVSLVVASLYLWIFGSLIPADKWQDVLVNAGLLLFIGLILLELFTYFATMSIYDKLLPAFELVEDSKSTRLKRIWKYVLAAAGIITFVGGILGIVQFFK